jgi:hypothetical protein
MKVAIICPICSNPRRLSDTYSVKLLEFPHEFADATNPEFAGATTRKEYTTRRIKVCRKCAKTMGYKVKLPVVKKTKIKPIIATQHES